MNDISKPISMGLFPDIVSRYSRWFSLMRILPVTQGKGVWLKIAISIVYGSAAVKHVAKRLVSVGHVYQGLTIIGQVSQGLLAIIHVVQG